MISVVLFCSLHILAAEDIKVDSIRFDPVTATVDIRAAVRSKRPGAGFAGDFPECANGALLCGADSVHERQFCVFGL